MTAVRYDFVIEKRARFYKEIDVVDANNNPISLVGYKIAVSIKESLSTTTVLFTLTEDNGGIQVLDDGNGKVALFISGTATDIATDYGVWDMKKIDQGNIGTDDDRLMQGIIEFSGGVV